MPSGACITSLNKFRGLLHGAACTQYSEITALNYDKRLPRRDL